MAVNVSVIILWMCPSGGICGSAGLMGSATVYGGLHIRRYGLTVMRNDARRQFCFSAVHVELKVVTVKIVFGKVKCVCMFDAICSDICRV